MNRRYGDYGLLKAEREYLTVPDNEAPEGPQPEDEPFDARQWTKEFCNAYEKTVLNLPGIPYL